MQSRHQFSYSKYELFWIIEENRLSYEIIFISAKRFWRKIFCHEIWDTVYFAFETLGTSFSYGIWNLSYSQKKICVRYSYIDYGIFHDSEIEIWAKQANIHSCIFPVRKCGHRVPYIILVFSIWTPGVGDGQGGLASCDSWGRKELDITEWLIWSDIKLWKAGWRYPYKIYEKLYIDIWKSGYQYFYEMGKTLW